MADGEHARTRVGAQAPARRPAPTTGRSPSRAGRCPACSRPGGAQTHREDPARRCPGERIVFAGSGPLALAFPAQLHGYGANVPLALEAGPPTRARGDVLRLLAAARGNVELLRDAARYRSQLLRARVPLRYSADRRARRGRRPCRARRARRGRRRLAPARGHRGDGRGRHALPRLRVLPVGRAAAARRAASFAYDEDLGGPVAVVDEWFRTTVAGHRRGRRRHRRRRLVRRGGRGTARRARRGARPRRDRRARRERAGDGSAGAARGASRRSAVRCGACTRSAPGIYELADGATDRLPLRGGDARRSSRQAIETSADVNVVKGFTRAGMGLCQGRNCQRQVAAMIARTPRRAARRRCRPRRPGCPCGRCRSARSPTRRSRTTGSSHRDGRLARRRRPARAAARVDGRPDRRRRPRRRRARVLPRARGHRRRRSSSAASSTARRRARTPAASTSRSPSTSSPRSRPTNVRDRLLDEVRLHAEAAAVWATLEHELDAPLDVHVTGGLMVAETDEQFRLLHDKQRDRAEAGLETHVLAPGRAARVRAVPRRRPHRRHVLPAGGAREPAARRAALRAARRRAGRDRPHARSGADGRRRTTAAPRFR